MLTWLLHRFFDHRHDPFLCGDEGMVSYGQLLEAIDLCDAHLGTHGIQAGQVVALLADYEPMSVAMLLALIERGCVIAPLSYEERLRWPHFFNVAQVEAVVSFFTREGAQWTWHTDVSAAHPLIQELRQRDEPGLVLFSSGSSGEPKGALHNFAPLLEKFKVQRHRYTTIAFLLFDHIGGINTLFYTLANGGAVVPIRDRDPDTVCAAIERYSVELLPTSPTFLNMMLVSGAYERHDLSSLKLVTYGTEVMPESTLQRIREVLPGVRLLQTYGLSELGILRSKSRDDGSLWVKVGGEDYQTKVKDGRLWVKAKSAMLGYLNAPSPFDADGWMDTGDAVEVDGEWLRILGRESEIINVGGVKVYPAEVESAVEEMDAVDSALVYGVPHPLVGNVIYAEVKIAQGVSAVGLAGDIKRHCRQRLGRHKTPSKVIFARGDLHTARCKKIRKR